MSITDLAHSAWFASLVTANTSGFYHSAYLSFNWMRRSFLYFDQVFFSPSPLCNITPKMPADELINAAFRVSAVLLNVGYFKASVHKIKAALVWSSCSNIDANSAPLSCLQTAESRFETSARVFTVPGTCAACLEKRALIGNANRWMKRLEDKSGGMKCGCLLSHCDKMLLMRE